MLKIPRIILYCTHVRADVAQVASELQTELGFKKGDTALLVSPNHADYFTVVHAILRLGGTEMC